MDQSAVAKHDAGDEAADPGANLNLLDGLEPSGEFVPLGLRLTGCETATDDVAGSATCCGGLSPQADSAKAAMTRIVVLVAQRMPD
jgi:hypothetical protein